MSHIAEVKTKINDLGLLKEILGEMGFKVVDGKTTVRDMVGKKIEVIAKVKGQEFGIVESKDASGAVTYDVKGELYHSGYYQREQDFANKLNKTYQQKKISREMESIGYRITQNDKFVENADGSIEFIMAKY